MAARSRLFEIFFLIRTLSFLHRKRPGHPSCIQKEEFVTLRIGARLAFFTAGIATSPWAAIVPCVNYP